MSDPAMRDGRDPLPEGATAGWRDHLGNIVAGLQTSRELTHNIRQNGRIRDLPSQQAPVKILARLSSALFPTHYGQADLTLQSIDGFVETALVEVLVLLEDQIRRDLLSSAQTA